MKDSTRPCPWHEANHDDSTQPGEHHLSAWDDASRGRSPRADVTSAVSAGVSGGDGSSGPIGSNTGGVVASVRTDRAGDPELAQGYRG
jgi:hypothetical protein